MGKVFIYKACGNRSFRKFVSGLLTLVSKSRFETPPALLALLAENGRNWFSLPEPLKIPGYCLLAVTLNSEVYAMTSQQILPATREDLEKILQDPRIRNTDKQGNRTPWAIRSHAAKGPVMIHFPHDTYVVMDLKTQGYPQKGFENCVCGLGGNYTVKEQYSPEDLMKKESKEELAAAFKALIKYDAFGEFFGVYPEEAHGNPRIGLYLNPVTWFVMHMNGPDAADVLKIARNDVSLEAFQNAVPPVTDFKSAAVFSLDEIRNGRLADGSVRFAWGDEKLLADTLVVHHCIDPRIPQDIGSHKHSTMYRQMDVPLNMPYKDRWTVQHDYTSEGGTKQTPDSHVFLGGTAKPK